MRYKRTILDSIIGTMKEYPITLITGARQVGKTTLVQYFEDKGYHYLTFDDTNLVKEAKCNPRLFIEKYGDHLILDEIQRVKELFVELEYKVNGIRKNAGSVAANGMYILIGSQKYTLMSEISESLSGRVGIVEMEPLSQSEIRGWKEKAFEVDIEKIRSNNDERSLSEDELYTSIVRGFYPARWEIEGQPIKNYYANYVKTFIERDVAQLINLKDLIKFENFLKVTASITGEECNISNISKVVGVDNKTVESWLNILIISNIICMLSPYYEDSINKRVVKRKKLYFNDTGLACYLIGIDTPKTLRLSSFKGRIVETYMHNEIRKSYINNDVDAKMFYYRDNNQNEIDIVILNDGNLYLVEFKAGKQYGINDIKGFRQLQGTKYTIKGQCIICLVDDIYRISSQTYAFPIRCI